MWEMKRAIEIFLTKYKINLLWIFEMCCPIGPKESLDHPKTNKKYIHDVK